MHEIPLAQIIREAELSRVPHGWPDCRAANKIIKACSAVK
jgi:hypothetical protein